MLIATCSQREQFYAIETWCADLCRSKRLRNETISWGYYFPVLEMVKDHVSDGLSENHSPAFRKKNYQCWPHCSLVIGKEFTSFHNSSERFCNTCLLLKQTKQAKKRDIFFRETLRLTCTGWKNGERTRLICTSTCGLEWTSTQTWDKASNCAKHTIWLSNTLHISHFLHLPDAFFFLFQLCYLVRFTPADIFVKNTKMNV